MRPRSSDPAENQQERRAKRRAVPPLRESLRVHSHPDIAYADYLVGRAGERIESARHKLNETVR